MCLTNKRGKISNTIRLQDKNRKIRVEGRGLITLSLDGVQRFLPLNVITELEVLLLLCSVFSVPHPQSRAVFIFLPWTGSYNTHRLVSSTFNFWSRNEVTTFQCLAESPKSLSGSSQEQWEQGPCFCHPHFTLALNPRVSVLLGRAGLRESVFRTHSGKEPQPLKSLAAQLPWSKLCFEVLGLGGSVYPLVWLVQMVRASVWWRWISSDSMAFSYQNNSVALSEYLLLIHSQGCSVPTGLKNCIWRVKQIFYIQ